MAALTTISVAYAGTLAAGTAVSASDTAEVGNGANTFLLYEGGSGTCTITITLPTTATPYTEAVAATVTYSLTASSRLAVPLHKDYAGSDGRCAIAHTGTLTSATVRVVRSDWA